MKKIILLFLLTFMFLSNVESVEKNIKPEGGKTTNTWSKIKELFE